MDEYGFTYDENNLQALSEMINEKYVIYSGNLNPVDT